MNAEEKTPPGAPAAIAWLQRRLGRILLAAALAPVVVAGVVAAVVRRTGGEWPVWPVLAGVVAAALCARLAARRARSDLARLAGELGGTSTAVLEARVRERTGELETARADLEEKSRRGEESDRLKSLFIANMSHEIRTPLNSVLALSQLLRDGVAGPLGGEQRRYLEVIERNGQNLLRLINDLLDLSRIEAGYVEMDYQDVALAPVVAEVVASLAPLAHEKDLEIVTRLPEDLPAIHCDADRLRQILNNLVGNAIKFTETGMVQITAETRNGAVAINVIDTGIGIPETDLEKVFQEFYQVDQTLARRRGGTGLGLAIAGRLARLMGGEISVSSIVGTGSRFTVLLPRAEAALPVAGPGISERTTPTRRAALGAESGLGGYALRPKVLLVEDNEDNLFTLRQVLARLPIDIVTATSGRQAIDLCRRALPDLVVMDVQMPGMSGLQTTGAIRALPGGNDVPILALTAQAMKGDRERILAAGLDEYLSKPIQPRALIDAVERLLGRGGSARGDARGEAGPTTGGNHGANGGASKERPDGAHPPRR